MIAEDAETIKTLQSQLKAAYKLSDAVDTVKEEAAKATALLTQQKEKYAQLQARNESLRDQLAKQTALAQRVAEENERLKEEARQRACAPVPAVPPLNPGLKAAVEYCIQYMSDIDTVKDAHVEPLKTMMEKLLWSESCGTLGGSEKISMLGGLFAVKEKRSEAAKRQKAQEQQKAQERQQTEKANTVINNYNSSIAQQSGAVSKLELGAGPDHTITK